MRACKPTPAAAERKTGDAGVRRGAECGDEACVLCTGIELGEQHAALRLRDALRLVDLDVFHQAQIDYEAAIAGRSGR